MDYFDAICVPSNSCSQHAKEAALRASAQVPVFWERFEHRSCALIATTLRLQVMEPQIARLRPAVLEADPSGVFAQKYLYDLLGL